MNTMTIIAWQRVTVYAAAWGLAAIATVSAAEQSASLGKVADTVVDRAALNFPKGQFGTCINGQTFQQEGLIAHGDYQYAAYFADGGVLCLARRKLPDGDWQRIRFDDYPALKHTDVHNVVSMGICPADGTIHLAFDHHNHPLHYRRSVAGLATKPAEFEWNAKLFGPTTAELEPGKRLEKVTYPQFFSTPQGKLQLLFRIGSSGDGDWHLAEYGPKGWQVLGKLLSRSGKYETSPSRCAYPNPPRYGSDGRLHVTWCWRERPAGGPFDLATNHDLCYAFSDDCGRTWKNNDGRRIAVLDGKGDEPSSIAIDSPGIVARPTRWLWGQMNTTTAWVDARGRSHAINWQNAPDAPKKSLDMNTWRYFHYWRDAAGKWREQRLPFFGRKPQIVLDAECNAYVVFCKGENLNYEGFDHGGTLKIAMATEASGWTDWRFIVEEKRCSVGEPLIDLVRWTKRRVLSVYLQDAPAEPGAASPLRVLDYDFGAR